MPLPLKPLSLKFRQEFVEAKTIFYREFPTVRSYERDLLIESCFLRCVIAWEEFIENYTLTCLCGGIIRPSLIVKPKKGIPISANLLDAFKSIRAIPGDWSTYYHKWLEPKDLKSNIQSRFDSRSRLQLVYLDTIKHDRIIVLRNAIAHSSRKTIRLLEITYLNHVGYFPYLSLTVKPVDFLTEVNLSGTPYFIVLLSFYEYLEDILMR